MSQRLYICALPGEKRYALVDTQDTLLEYYLTRDMQSRLFGNVYYGRISRIDKRLGGAFVDIGLEQAGFLPLSAKGDAAGHPTLSEGTYIFVEVSREPKGDKGAKLKKIEDAGLQKPAKVPGLVLRGDDPLHAMLGQGANVQRNRDIGEIVSNSSQMLSYFQQISAVSSDKEWRRTLDPEMTWFPAKIEEQIEALSHRKIALPDGGFLLIEPVETLTAIDVNMGDRQERLGGENAAFSVNMGAVGEIARQIHLRSLSGLIVVDFLPLKKREWRTTLEDKMRTVCKALDGYPQVSRLSHSGLMELSRQRRRLPLHEILSVPCGEDGGGWRKKSTTLAFEVIRKLYALSAVTSLEVRLHPDVKTALETYGKQALDQLAERRKWTVSFQEDPNLSRTTTQIMTGDTNA